jgi:hypothetical protein
MRCQFVQLIVLAIAYSGSWDPSTHAQVSAMMFQAQDSEACSLAPLPEPNRPSAPQVTIAELVFDGNLQVPIEDQNQLSDSLKQQASRLMLTTLQAESKKRFAQPGRISGTLMCRRGPT